MLKTHFDAIEASLIAISKTVSHTGHSLHKGLPRELFLQDFLVNHVGKGIGIGTGEIIDSESQPGAKRNQIDIVLYHEGFPKLHLKNDINCFFVESLFAAIEVKSNLTKQGFRKSLEAAINLKALTPHVTRIMQAGYTPPKPLGYKKV